MKKIVQIALFVFCFFMAFQASAEEMKLVLTLDLGGEDLASTKPMVADINGDGLVDLFLAHDGGMKYFIQNEIGKISFSQSDEAVSPALSSGYIVGLSDLDNDGLFEFIYANAYSPVNWYEQASSGSLTFENIAGGVALSGFDFSSHGRYASDGVFEDLDGDGLLDALIGYGDTHSGNSAEGTDQEREMSGILHFEQASVGSNTFNLIDDYFNDIADEVCCGFKPTLVKLNPGSNIWHLIVGTQNGKLLHYRQKEENSYEFELITTEFGKIEVGSTYPKPTFYDLDGDENPELILGDQNGEVRVYQCQNSFYYEDVDGDGYGDPASFTESCYIPDGIYVENNEDALPLDPTENLDADGDGIGNNADTDDDGDGVEDSLDAFPLDATESVDTDGDGIGNNADTDDDNDGILDDQDPFPLEATVSGSGGGGGGCSLSQFQFE